jgi:isopentenyl diphosphate isomerase/L-lactate dehydrogenase-like FMN-dependent dehydrogenase
MAPPIHFGPRLAARLAAQVLARPLWTARTLPFGLHALLDRAATLGDASPVLLSRHEDEHRFAWSDIAWMRAKWSGHLVVKGVLTDVDAIAARDAGADAIVVSNHGGRQLDGAPATLRALPEVVEAVGGSTEVLLDGGIRRATDVIKALCLGARAVLIGRPYVYGLAAAGQAGVERILEIFRHELVRTMMHLGCSSVQELNPNWLQPMRPMLKPRCRIPN